MHEERPVTGTVIYYYQICHRKLYYFTHELQMEQNNEAVALGRLLDENSYTRDAVRHITIDDTISVDFIRKGKVLHEIKKSRSVEEASVWQLKYYLYYLQDRGLTKLHGQIDYPLLRQTVAVELTDEDIVKIAEILTEVSYEKEHLYLQRRTAPSKRQHALLYVTEWEKDRSAHRNNLGYLCYDRANTEYPHAESCIKARNLSSLF